MKILGMIRNVLGIKSPFGYYLQVDLKQCDHDKISNGTYIHGYILELCELIGMKRYGDPNLMRFGDGDLEGWSFAQMIETSCVCGHFDEQNGNSSAYIDIFSCKPFNKDIAKQFTVDYFNARKVKAYYKAR